MASTKIIAICQAGGEFSSDRDGLLSYAGGDAFAIDIDEQTKFNDFKTELADMFNYSADSMVVKYFLPGNKKILITISKDKDLQRMVSFVAKAGTVDVFILTGDASARNVSHMPASRSSRTTVSEAENPPVAAVENDAHNNLIECITNDHTNSVVEPHPIGVETDNAALQRCTTFTSAANQHQKAAMQWENAITGVDQRFGSFDEFRELLRKYSVAHGFGYKYKKNDSHRVTVKCKSEGCRWRIYASRLAGTELICIKKMVSKHTCEGLAPKPGCRAMRNWVGSIIKEKVKVSPNYKPKDIADDIKREFGIELNYSQAWRAKEVAREELLGSYNEAYSHLPILCQKIMETNPGSVAAVTTKKDSSFHRLFISFHASIIGFQQGCRPLLFLDSIPLNSKYQGELLAATAVDGNDGVFTVAFAVVDVETEENWHWFLEELKSVVSMSCPITFVAGFQNGLKELLPQVFSNSYHGYCLRYMADKLNKDLQGQLSHEARRLMVNDLYAAAYALKLEDFQHCVNNLKAISSEAYDWVIKSELKQWANAFFDGERYNLMNSNFGLLFYNWVSEVSELPITQMVDVLRVKMMELINTRMEDCRNWVTRLTPSKEELLEKEALKARSFQVLPHGNMFEVRGQPGHVSNMVDLDNCVCSCKGWQVNGLPCCHVIAVSECTGRDPYDYCSKYFLVDCYRLTYAESIHPVPNVEILMETEENQLEATVSPPSTKRPPGRPKMKQAESVDILKRQLQCSKCKGLGHNKKTCKTS